MPDAFRSQVGKTELVRPLKTYSLRKARPLAALITALVIRVFEMINLSETTTHQALRLVQVMAKHETCGGFVPVTDQPELQYKEQSVLSEDHMADLHAQIDVNDFHPDILHQVCDPVIRQGHNPNIIPPFNRSPTLTKPHMCAGGITPICTASKWLNAPL